MHLFQQIKEGLLHLAFPHVCAGCGSDVLGTGQAICLRCLYGLPRTSFEAIAENPVEKVFWGRLPLKQASAHFYFTKDSLLQTLMHAFKYRGQQELGQFLGQQMGAALLQSGRFQHIDAIIPLPLHPSKEKRRGYNQATLLCQGIACQLQKPIITNAACRLQATESQTRKNRVGRWQNMEGRFSVNNAEVLQHKHLLLVDDVVTTGATLEACGSALLMVPGVKLSIATLCFASGT